MSIENSPNLGLSSAYGALRGSSIARYAKSAYQNNKPTPHEELYQRINDAMDKISIISNKPIPEQTKRNIAIILVAYEISIKINSPTSDLTAGEINREFGMLETLCQSHKSLLGNVPSGIYDYNNPQALLLRFLNHAKWKGMAWTGYLYMLDSAGKVEKLSLSFNANVSDSRFDYEKNANGQKVISPKKETPKDLRRKAMRKRAEEDFRIAPYKRPKPPLRKNRSRMK